MQSCNRVFVSVFLLLSACDAEAAGLASTSVQNVGLVQTSGTPPLGDGVAPLDGTGGDGLPSVPGKGLAEGGPGAIRWYGGQWLIPYSGTPGATIQNVSCDVVPNASSTDLIELVGASGVIGSTTVPATTGVVIRAWITTPHVIADGEVFVIRHSPRDSTTGAWTSGVQQLTIVECSVNVGATRTVTIPISPPYTTSGGGLRNFVTVAGSSATRQTIIVPLSFPVGQTIVGLRARVADSSGGPGGQSFFAHSLVWQGDNSEIFTTLATATPSTGNAIEQTVSIPSLSAQIAPGREYFVLLSNSAGTGTTIVYRLEADIQ